MTDERPKYAEFDEHGNHIAWIVSRAGLPKGHTVRRAPKLDLATCAWDGKNKRWITCPHLHSTREKERERARIELDDADSGPWKAVIYAAKALEVWRMVQLLRAGEPIAADDFPFMAEDAKAFGDTLEHAFGRFEKGMRAAHAQLAKIEAETQKAIADAGA